MNKNHIITDAFSNPESHDKYQSLWEGEADVFEYYSNGIQCGGCSFFAPFDSDWGLCCHEKSRHYLETVFEHFTCPTHVNEGWTAHSFIDPQLNPYAWRLRQLQLELSEEVFARAEEIAKDTDKTPYEVIYLVLLREFGYRPTDD